jgi:hypothetical protein
MSNYLKCRRVLVCISTFLFIFISANISFAESKKGAEAEISFEVSEIFYMINLMQRIELSGSEVQAFLDVYNKFIEKAEQARKDNKKPKDKIKITIAKTAVANCLTFIQRASLTGGEATQFQAIVDKILNALK